MSVTQIGGGALAAVTAAVAASYLGVAGTISGAAVGSVISTIAATLYSNSLKRAALASRTLVVKQTLAPAVRSPQPEVAEPPGEPEAAPHLLEDSVWQRIRWKPVMLVAGGVFVIAMAFIFAQRARTRPPDLQRGRAGDDDQQPRWLVVAAVADPGAGDHAHALVERHRDAHAVDVGHAHGRPEPVGVRALDDRGDGALVVLLRSVRDDGAADDGAHDRRQLVRARSYPGG